MGLDQKSDFGEALKEQTGVGEGKDLGPDIEVGYQPKKPGEDLATPSQLKPTDTDFQQKISSSVEGQKGWTDVGDNLAYYYKYYIEGKTDPNAYESGEATLDTGDAEKLRGNAEHNIKLVLQKGLTKNTALEKLFEENSEVKVPGTDMTYGEYLDEYLLTTDKNLDANFYLRLEKYLNGIQQYWVENTSMMYSGAEFTGGQDPIEKYYQTKAAMWSGALRVIDMWHERYPADSGKNLCSGFSKWVQQDKPATGDFSY